MCGRRAASRMQRLAVATRIASRVPTSRHARRRGAYLSLLLDAVQVGLGLDGAGEAPQASLLTLCLGRKSWRKSDAMHFCTP